MNESKKIMAVIGTRPDAIKMCPLIKELESREGYDIKVCATGQHRELLDDVLEYFSVKPHYDLDIMKKGQDLFGITSEVLLGMRAVLTEEHPHAILVHGDTTSAFAASLAAFYLRIPVYHVEAGLRTYDLGAPFPEEFNRRAIGMLAKHHFSPTDRSGENLIFEGVGEDRISITGNTVIDAMKKTVRSEYSHPLLSWVGDGRLLLLTAHRRENHGSAMENIFSAVKRIAERFDDLKIIYPVHPNPAIGSIAEKIFNGCSKIRLCQPLSTIDFHNILARSYLVLTDSGGVQEEALALRKPVLVLRNTTERMEGIACGGSRLVGTKEETVYRSACDLLQNPALHYAMSVSNNPYGDGKASVRIADTVEKICL